MEKEGNKDPTRSPSSGSEDSEEDIASEQAIEDGSMTAATTLDPSVLKNRREKRLAMNRASARARRKRKKELLGSLAVQVQELTSQNQVLQTKNESLSTRVEQLESALTQAQTTITTLSGGNSAVPSLHQSLAGATSAGDSTLRSMLLGAGSGLNHHHGGAASGLGAGGLSYDTLLAARAQQHLEMQNQLRLLGASSGLGASGLGSLQPSALAPDRLGSLAGVSGLGASGLGALLGGGLAHGMPPPAASQLDSLVRAKTTTGMQATDEQGSSDKPTSPAKGGGDEPSGGSKTIGTGAAIRDVPAAKKPRI